MFDSPIAYCAVARGYVLLDQTPRECAREHRCRGAEHCPLRRYFVKYCPVREQHVLVYQAQRECAREHGCEGLRCPLRRFFACELSEAPGPMVPAMDCGSRPPPLSAS